ncbi:MAG: hypothetical protein WD887_01235 [Candidatus Saccharimonadales bacterium]
MSSAEISSEMRELDEFRDGFGNNVRLLWNPSDGSTHLVLEGYDMKVDNDAAGESRFHLYPLLCSKIGEVAVEEFTVPQ